MNHTDRPDPAASAGPVPADRNLPDASSPAPSASSNAPSSSATISTSPTPSGATDATISMSPTPSDATDATISASPTPSDATDATISTPSATDTTVSTPSRTSGASSAPDLHPAPARHSAASGNHDDALTLDAPLNPDVPVDPDARPSTGTPFDDGADEDDATDEATPPRRAGVPWGSILRNASLVLVVLGMLWLALNVRLPDLSTLDERIEGYGWAGVFVFIALYAVVALTPIPITIMAVAGGMAFGVLLGTPLSLIGVTLGSWGAYGAARGLGQKTVLKMLGGHAHVVESQLVGGGFYAVCTLRLAPGIPYWPVNYGAGAFGVPHRDFLAATILASAPGQLSLVAIGAFIADPGWINGSVVVISWIVVLVLSVLAFRRWRRDTRSAAPDAGAATPRRRGLRRSVSKTG
ncbi:VTT domain-containing protein [Brachybacterium huguangmaarense]|uniref:TVP38/TMEM64 family membrane protein n=1 Tax=Brachybacterium huguangmaarense TaxID=1652028 RepID=A0ABY6G2N0_9MICO|nr:VTT domain-containing protein [Brachybacterium huguangmaarense]UYG17453.1 VTT domain-containing protein [Brachybacterium huguangmaarense]